MRTRDTGLQEWMFARHSASDSKRSVSSDDAPRGLMIYADILCLAKKPLQTVRPK